MSRLVLTAGRLDAGRVFDLSERDGERSWGGVPTAGRAHGRTPRLRRDDLSSLRPLGGAPIFVALFARLQQQVPPLREGGLANMWGIAESGGFVTLAREWGPREALGDGRPPLPVLRAADDSPDSDGCGEVLVRSPTVMLGYLVEDDVAADADNWLRSGHLGRLDGYGCLLLVERSKDVVIRDGENISCPSVETALLHHPDVK
ncbi:AMP-binding protein [Georgenia ruanii]|uniref:AMP-binding protein n=1 Tax=Georgenia ruanii TaxID=348442 RepID=UPI00186AD4DB|nr:AMP-binding protein [Georgenia ruanii]